MFQICFHQAFCGFYITFSKGHRIIMICCLSGRMLLSSVIVFLYFHNRLFSSKCNLSLI